MAQLRRALVFLSFAVVVALFGGLALLTAQALPVTDGAQAVFVGESTADAAGYCVASAGDVNGDGLDDLLIGAPMAGGGAGKVYLVLGQHSPTWGQGLAQDAAASFVGEAAGDRMGWRVAGAGDADGDGLDDFLLGAPNNGGAGSYAGAAYLFFGRATANWGHEFNAGGADVIFRGETAGDQLGGALAGAGDVNRDGRGDLLLGASENGEGGTGAGKAYLVLGRPRGAWPASFGLSQANASFVGGGPNWGAGSAVSGVGDVDNDGYGDVLIGAPGTGGGRACLLLGGSPLPWGNAFDLAGADAIFLGEHSGDEAGFAVSSAGDVDDDGHADFLIGAYFNDDGGDRSGKAYLLLGRQQADWGREFALGNADASYVGAAARSYAGSALASVQDVNGDGHDDFLVAAYGADASTTITKTGCVYLVLGKASGWTKNVSLAGAADGSAIRPYTGEHSGANLGQSVSSAGDANGDGHPDMLIGEPFLDGGRAYLILGRAAGEGLQVQKSAPRFVAAGDVITYSISYANAGGCIMQAVFIHDLVPTGTIFLSSTGGMTRTHEERRVSWWLGALAPGDHGRVQLVVRVPAAAAAGTIIANTAWITSPNSSSAVLSHAVTGVLGPSETPAATATATVTPTRTATTTATPTGTSVLTLCVPSLISPAPGAVLDNGRYDRLDPVIWDFDWSDCPGASVYHLYVAGPSATIPSIDNSAISGSSYHHVLSGTYISDSNLQNWTWKVRAQVAGQWGAWSETRTFDVEPVNTDPPSVAATATGTVTPTPTRTVTPTSTGTVTLTPTRTLTRAPDQGWTVYLPITLKGQAPGTGPTPTATLSEVELAYDDGTAETVAATYPSNGFAVCFNPPPGVGHRLQRGRFRLTALAPFQVHVWDHAWQDMFPPFTVTPVVEGWVDVDFSAQSIVLTPGVPFYVGMTYLEHYNPNLGLDYDPPWGCSYKVQEHGGPTPVAEMDYMIRAVVQ